MAVGRTTGGELHATLHGRWLALQFLRANTRCLTGSLDCTTIPHRQTPPPPLRTAHLHAAPIGAFHGLSLVRVMAWHAKLWGMGGDITALLWCTRCPTGRQLARAPLGPVQAGAWAKGGLQASPTSGHRLASRPRLAAGTRPASQLHPCPGPGWPPEPSWPQDRVQVQAHGVLQALDVLRVASTFRPSGGPRRCHMEAASMSWARPV